ncbi:hypothetical protein JOC75_004291 [Metabacillus crassostreae]|uniref:DUF6470 family protein n=1 Tax=Metabacillus crassostreae TaxID=929098 RepID=UPI00195C82D3|nr:hypothetical protein [Metabacillus crassostreae]
MNIPQIRLQSIFAQIGIHTNHAKLQIDQEPADLSIQQPRADISIETKPSRLTIDQTEARADMDLKSIGRRIEEAAQLGKSNWLEGITRRIREGQQLMKIENGGNPIAEISKHNSREYYPPVNIKFIPSAGSVKINYEPAKVNIDVRPNKPIIDVGVNEPIMEYLPGNVDITLERRNELEIDFEPALKEVKG